MTSFRRVIADHPILKNNPRLKKNLESLANRTGIIGGRSIEEFFIDREDVPERGADDVSKLFYSHTGDSLIHKWGHYLPIYDRLFAPYRDRALAGRPLRFLEIGVSQGGSLDLWRRYFGDAAIIYGIDIDPACRTFDGRSAQVRIGSQADPDFLAAVVREMGGLDVVLDDGSHVASHMRVSFETLFPRLAADGLYVAEDLHCAYWPGYEGGLRRRGSFIELTKSLIDDIHHWYHGKPKRHQGFDIGAIHLYDSIVAFEKSASRRPFHTVVGRSRP